MSIQPFIRCKDLSVSLPFYSEILDFKILRAPDPDPESFMSKYSLLERNGDRVHLSAHSGDGVFGNVVYVQVENIDTLFEKFLLNGLTESDRGGLTMRPVEQTWGMKEFAVTDPDGNRITFGHPL
ncbi:MAG: VOC family protein [Granulosicoccus sp.]|nr:VOC family protein [Granulosicoccus sp.]